jgi:hypothetical protein
MVEIAVTVMGARLHAYGQRGNLGEKPSSTSDSRNGLAQVQGTAGGLLVGRTL